MNGPEHYAEAERLLRIAEGAVGDSRLEKYLTNAAQAHATLALAAATIDARRGGVDVWTSWPGPVVL